MQVVAVIEEQNEVIDAMALRRLARTECNARVRVRMIMISHMLDGVSAEEAAFAVGLRRTAGYRWAARFESEGIDGLRDRPRVGRPRKLDTGKEQAFRDRFLGQHQFAPDGSPVAVVRGQEARRILDQEFSATYGLSGTYALMQRLGLTRAEIRTDTPLTDQ